MVKILGLKCKSILPVLFAFYWELNAGFRYGFKQTDNTQTSLKYTPADKLEFWEPDPKYDLRRTVQQPMKKPGPHLNQSKPQQPQPQNKKGRPKLAALQQNVKNNKGPEPLQFRNKGQRTGSDPDKYMKGLQTEMHHSPPKQIARNGRPHIEFLQLHHENKNKIDSKHKKGTNYSSDKDHNNDKEHSSENDDKSDSDHNKNKDRSDSEFNKNDEMNKNNKNKYNNKKGHSKKYNKDKEHAKHHNNKDKEHNSDSDHNKKNKTSKNKIHRSRDQQHAEHDTNDENEEHTSSDSDHNKNSKIRENKNRSIRDQEHTEHDSDNEDEEHSSDSDHNKNNKMSKNKIHSNSDKNHKIDKKHDRPDNRSHNINGKLDHKIKENNFDDNDNMDKNHKMHTNYKTDKSHDMHKSHNIDNKHGNDNKHNMNKNRNTNMNKNEDSNQSSDKNEDNLKKKKEKNRNSENLHIRLPKISPEVVSSKSVSHQHRARLRTQRFRDTKDDIYIRSTRMTPMYLMQQPPEDEEQTTRTTRQPEKGGGGGETLNDNARTMLTPYAIMSQMQQIMTNFPTANATFDTISRTVEYNDIILIKVTEKKSDIGKYFRAEESKYIDEVPEKKIIFIVHGLSVMGINKLQPLNSEHALKLLLSYYFAHLDKFDIYLMPMANPDGYSATFSNNINMWNKNVSPQDACRGVMLDRNFDVAWNATRQISSCSMLYPGSSPFSETETKAVRDVFHYHGHKIIAYIHVHAGTYRDNVFKGDAILYPRGYSESQSDDDKYIDLKAEIEEAMKNASFQVMSVTVDTLHNWYGKVTGTSVDYASTVYGIPYALEFVMQIYSNDELVSREQSYEYFALTEIWSRLIDTTFNNMWKSLNHVNEVKRK